MKAQLFLSDGTTLYDPKHWYDKRTAAAFMGTTTRTLERWIETKLHPLTLKRAAQHPITVFAKAELERVKKERSSQTTPAFRQPSPTLPTPRHTDVAVSTGRAVASENARVTTAAEAYVSPLSGTSGLALAALLFEKGTYLTLKEARALTRWSEPALKQAVHEHRVQRAPGRTWLLRTVDVLQL